MKNKVFLAVAVLAALGLAIVYGYGGGGSSKEAEATTYETVAAETGNIKRIVSATGPVRPVVTVEIGSQLSGQVQELFADYNSVVEAGQLIARIDPQTFATRVTQAEADLALAKANVAVQEANVEKAVATLARSKRDYDRFIELQDTGAVSAATLDQTINTFEIAKADLTIAKAQLLNAKVTIKQRDAALKQAMIDLDRTEIRSPIKGIVVERSVDVGQTVAASFSAPVLFQIAQDLGTIQIEASIDEADIGSVKQGNPVTFTVDAYPDTRFTGSVDQVRLAATELANVVTYTTVIKAANPGLRLLPGMTANVEIVTGERRDVVRLPNQALRFRPPQDVLDAAQSRAQNGRGGPGGRGGRGGFSVDALAEPYGLTDDQKAALSEKIAPARAAIGAAFRNGGQGVDRAAIFAQFRAKLTKAIEDVFTPDQLAQYQEAQKNAGRRATVWALDDTGTPTPKRVMVGIDDGRFTEVVRGLEAGQPVILREARTP